MKYVNPTTPHTHPVRRPLDNAQASGKSCRPSIPTTQLDPDFNRAVVGAAGIGAGAVGALALGSLAIAAGSIAALAIWQLTIRNAKIRNLHVQNLEVRNIKITGRSAAGIQENGGVLRFDLGSFEQYGDGAE